MRGGSRSPGAECLQSSFRASTDVRPPSPLHASESPCQAPFDFSVEIDGIHLHYEAYPGHGEPIVLVHGLASSTYSWRGVIPHLTEAGFPVYALDMKGFGWSDKPIPSDYSPTGLMKNVLAWMDALAIGSCIFCGNSLGGGIGLLMALNRPGRLSSLILIDAAGYPQEKPLFVKFLSYPLLEPLVRPFFGRPMVAAALKQAFFDRDKVTRDRIEAYYARLRTRNALAAAGKVAAGLSRDMALSVSSRLKDIRIPVLVLWGREDAWIPVGHAFRFRDDIPGATLVVFPGCGHVPQEEEPLKTARAILDFLRHRKGEP